MKLFFQLTLTLAVAWTVGACGGSKFSSNQGGQNSNQVAPGSPQGGNPGGNGMPPPINPNGNQNNTPAGGLLVNQGQADCLLKKADRFNISIVFDNSGSTTTTDPANVRQQSALQFAKKFVEFVSLNPKADVRISAIKFAKTTTRGPHVWVKLSVSNEQDIAGDIIASTTGSEGGTAYTPAIAESGRLMAEAGANPGDKRQRNYTIFLSDGRPNGSGENKSTVNLLFDPLVNQYGVAVYSIGAGSGLKSDDEQVMQSLAKPTTGIVSPQHVGMYKRGASPAELQNAWDQIFNQIATCD